MATINVTLPADVLAAPVAWDRQCQDQFASDMMAQRAAAAAATLVETKANVRIVLEPLIVRAGGVLGPAENVTNVVRNPDGTVTITTA